MSDMIAGGLPANPELTAKLKAAVKRGMTAEERLQQRASFVFGQLPMGTKTTREEVTTLVMQDYQAGVEAERKRCVGVLVREARTMALASRLCERKAKSEGPYSTGYEDRRDMAIEYRNDAANLMILARELYGHRKGDDHADS